MEPRIQYAKTSDGVSIAYYTIGNGLPLVSMPWLLSSHLQLEWQIPMIRQEYEFAARYGTLVRYDSRGFGLSDRDVGDFSIEALVRDLEAVVARLELGRFQLLATGFTVPVAISYAAANPDDVSHLVLQYGFARGSDVWSEPLEGLANLAETDWELASEAFVRAVLGWSQGEFPSQLAALMREAVAPATLALFLRQIRDWDVTSVLPKVRASTLVLDRRENRYVEAANPRKLAATIPGAQMLLLEEGSSPAGAIAAFLSRDLRPSDRNVQPRSGTAVILFADIADSTALTEHLGDAAFRAKARELGGPLRELIRECGGTPVEGPTLGDGVLAVFTSAREAIEAARRCARSGDDAGLPLHLGLHAGDVSREKDPDGRDNVYGGAVNIAARISSLSAPGEVLVSDTVRSLARTSAGVRFEDRGEQALKGVGEPVRVWRVAPA